MEEDTRAGIGYDLHRLVEGRKLILGGVEIACEKGALGHSDADALIHAICDALLGAAGLGDIGQHFPDSDPHYKNISSLILLEQVNSLLIKNNFCIGHIDCVITVERPRLAPYIEKMRSQLADKLNVNISQINIKVKTNEGIGAIGRGEAIAASAVCIIKRVRGPGSSSAP